MVVKALAARRPRPRRRGRLPRGRLDSGTRPPRPRPRPRLRLGRRRESPAVPGPGVFRGPNADGPRRQARPAGAGGVAGGRLAGRPGRPGAARPRRCCTAVSGRPPYWCAATRTADGKAVRWRVKLLDAGLSLERDVIHASASNPAARVQTALGRSVARTIGYAPPEVVGKPKGHVWVGPHSDVYAFGKLTAFALTGRPDPDGGDLVILPEPWKQLLDDLTGWTIRARPPHFGAVLDRLSQLPGAGERVNAVERDMYESTIADHTAALAADPADFAALVSRGQRLRPPGRPRAGRRRLRPGDPAAARRRRAVPPPRPGPRPRRRPRQGHRGLHGGASARTAQPGGTGQPRPGPRPAARSYDPAIADYTEALRLNPRDEALYYNRGNAHYCKAEYDRAIADYTEAVRLDPRNAWAFGNRGKAHALRGEHGRAVADFGRVLHLDPKNVKAIVGPSLVVRRTGPVRQGARRLRRRHSAGAERRAVPRARPGPALPSATPSRPSPTSPRRWPSIPRARTPTVIAPRSTGSATTLLGRWRT